VQAAFKQFHEAADRTTAARAAVIETTIVVMTWIVVGLAGFLVTGLAALAYAIVSRGVVRPLAILVALLERLAQGDEVEITGVERPDEIGHTARAVDGIKTMLTQKARHDAQEKAGQDKRAAAEREATMVLVDQIVHAAAAGDFSKRVALEGETGIILDVGASINALCGNVGNALEDLIEMLSALADGNLTKRITADCQGAFATLKDDANRTADRLTEIVSGIKSVGCEVANAATEISASTTGLAQRTEEQAAGLDQTTASMQEMSATVKRNADSALRANQLTNGSRDVAERSGQVVAKAVDAMARIEDSSRKISDIIGVIDAIARQTNLLALNAAVEAARAGDAGRGFAVVASEVCSLAQRSSQAAKDIKVLITNSSGQVQEGVELVNQTGTSLTEILASIGQVVDIVAQIAAASNEQSTGIEQINKSLIQMDAVTRQNSDQVEKNAASAAVLDHQAEAMNQKVAFFKIDESPAHNATRAPGPAARHAATTSKRKTA
jgi:methyl-accepting chemotaxis protein